MAKRPRRTERARGPAPRRGRRWRTVGGVALGVGLAALTFYAAGHLGRREAADDGDHGHRPAAHGGLIVSLGQEDRYHVEAVLEKGGLLKLYTLGRDVGQVLEVESQTLPARVRAEGGAGDAPVLLLPAPQPGDADGKTSRFVGHLPRGLWGKSLVVTVPALAIAGERFSVEFTVPRPAHGKEAAEPDQGPLYRNPGGLYTEADIAANGGTTAARKYEGFRTVHDVNPRPGDRICPVTRTKADPACTWVVGGRTYQFCCPPCIDEFVRAARERPGEVKEPGDYVKK